MNKSLALATLFLAGTVTVNSSQAATSWDATKDFTAKTTVNPNGVWSYGYDPAATAGYQFKAFNKLSGTTLPIWNDSAYTSLLAPNFVKNLSTSSTFGILPGQISIHPGPVASGDAAILRFKAPIAAIYALNGQFFAGDGGETDAKIVKNGNLSVPLKTLGITSTNPAFSISGLELAVGDTIDFVVGNQGSFNSDSTPLTVQITSAPILGKVSPSIGTTLTGFTGTAATTCKNTRTGQTVNFNGKSNLFLDCKAAGLLTKDGDNVSITTLASTAAFASHQYELEPNCGTWANCKAMAETLGAHLATITTPEEQAFVFGKFKGAGNLWIGLSDQTTEGTFQWLNTEPFVFKNWNAGQPDDKNGNEDCVAVTGTGKWSDLNCSLDLPAIFEYE